MKEPISHKQIVETTLKGTLINILLTVVKFAAAILGTSAAMLADAVHSLSDLITDLIVLIYVKLGGEREGHVSGRGRFEFIITIIIGVILLLLGFAVCYYGMKNTISAFQGHILERPGYIALFAAILSIILKEWAYRFTMRTAHLANTGLLAANAMHHRSDALSSLGTTIGISCAIFLGERWRVLDPITCVIVSFFIMSIAYHLMSDAVNNMLGTRLPENMENEIAQIAISEEGVSSIDTLLARRVNKQIFVKMRLSMPGDMTVADASQVTLRIEEKLREKYGQNLFLETFILSQSN